MRQSWDDYFTLLCYHVAWRSTCTRRMVGVAVTDQWHHIVSTGYNGAESGAPHCIDVGCDMEDGTCRRTIHAEQNALEYIPWDVLGCTLYSTDFPCPNCAQLIAEDGRIVEVVYVREYHTGVQESMELLQSKGIEVRRFIPDMLLTEG